MLKLLTFLVALIAPSLASAQNVAALAGTWQVVTTQTEGTCSNLELGSVAAYQWIVSVSPPNNVRINVLGETSFPTLEGSMNDAGMLTLLDSSSTGAASWFSLKVGDDGRMTGVRRYLGWNAKACFVDSSVVATR